MADRIALIERGRIAQLGSPRALYEHPANRFVAGFIGVMNFLPGRLAADGLVEVDGLGRFRGALAEGAATVSGAPAALAVRPERLRVALAKPAVLGDNPPDGPGDGPGDEPDGGAIGGRVRSIAYMGQDLMVHLAVAGLEAPLIARLGAGHAIAGGLAEGVEVWCDWPAEHARVLPD